MTTETEALYALFLSEYGRSHNMEFYASTAKGPHEDEFMNLTVGQQQTVILLQREASEHHIAQEKLRQRQHDAEEQMRSILQLPELLRSSAELDERIKDICAQAVETNKRLAED